MKRYACHRVYTQPKQYLKQAVVTIDNQGIVISCSTFNGEMSGTEWIGGVIYLSNASCTPIRDFNTFLENIKTTDDMPIYAWHLSDFDFERERILPQCRIRKL